MDLRDRMIGNTNQIFKARRIAFLDGRSQGVRAIEIQNEDGIYTTCIEDQCLNLYDFHYKGINFAFYSKNGLTANGLFSAGEFSHRWPAGMLYICGLTNAGRAITEDGTYYPAHGRISMMPAEDVNIEKNETAIVIKGKVRESILRGSHLELQRTITVPIRGKEIHICDRLVNLEPTSTEYMLLYHFNFGYPLLAPGAFITKSHGQVIRLDSENPVPENWSSVDEPQNHKTEELYCHENIPDINGFAYAAILNDKLKLGSYVKYKIDTLPYLIHWKNMCAHDYCVGLEPSNTTIRGRAEERRRGTLPVIGGYETRVFEVALGVLEGEAEMRQFQQMLSSGDKI